METWSEPDSKKIAAVNDPFGAQLAAMKQQGGPTSPQQMNAAKAGQPHLGMGSVSTEEIMVPDKMVGLIIGRGGEQISRMQGESGCKIQMAADSGGMPDRVCTLTGTRDSITRAKELVMAIVQQRGVNDSGGSVGSGGMGGAVGGGGGGGGIGVGANFVEIMVPGPKVGLIIGKGGETIKQLQEKSGAKMVVIQDGPQQEFEKPLRISGDPQKVEVAKQLALELLAEKDGESFGGGRGRGRGQGFPVSEFGGGGPGQDVCEVPVPKPAVGVIIGKGGEMIKKIQNESGAHVQFQQGREEGPGDRICVLTGNPRQVQEARGMIEDLIESVMQREGGRGWNRERGGSGGRGDGGGAGNWGGRYDERRGPPGGGAAPWDPSGEYGGPRQGEWDQRRGPPGGGPGRNRGEKAEITFTVPAHKCGIVIGKGGETIKSINQQTGAHCELDRRPPPNPNDKVFLIRGSQEQVEHAKRLITERIGMGQQDPNSQYQMGQGPGPGSQGGGGPPQGFAPQGWGNTFQQWQNQPHPSGDAGQVTINPQTGQPDYSAQWAEYYRSQGMHREASMIEQQAKQAVATSAPQQAPAQPIQQQPQQPAAAQQNGQPDYSAQWAEYYRSIGKTKEAEALEAQIKQKQQQQQQTQTPSGTPNPQPGQPGPGQAAPAASGQPYPGYQQYPASGYYGGGQPGGQPGQYQNYMGYQQPQDGQPH